MDALTNTACEECNQFDLGARRCRHVACRESIRSLKLENEHLKERLQSARDELMEHEEEEGSRCPEDVGFLEYTDALEKQLAAARAENVCDACCGTGKPVSGLPCMCGGSGKMSDAVTYMRERLVRAEMALESHLRARPDDGGVVRDDTNRLDWLLSFASIEDVGDEHCVPGVVFRIEDAEGELLGESLDWTPRQFIDAAIARNAAADGGKGGA